MGKRKKWNKQKVIDAIRERDRRGLPLAGVGKDNRSLEIAGREWFGSWPNAVLAAGLKPKVCRTWNKAAVVAAIKDRHQCGLPLKNIRKHDLALGRAARRYFGSWTKAMSAAGLKKLVQKQRSWTKQAVIDGILERNERDLPMLNIVKYDRQLYKAVLKYFGSWRDAILAAGLKPQPRGQWSKEKVIEQIQWWHSKGVPPSKIYLYECRLRRAGNKYFSGCVLLRGSSGIFIVDFV